MEDWTEEELDAEIAGMREAVDLISRGEALPARLARHEAAARATWEEIQKDPPQEWEVDVAILMEEANALLDAGDVDGYQRKLEAALALVEEG